MDDVVDNTDCEGNQDIRIDIVPSEVLSIIFNFLRIFDQFKRLGYVCKEWNSIIYDQRRYYQFLISKFQNNQRYVKSYVQYFEDEYKMIIPHLMIFHENKHKRLPSKFVNARNRNNLMKVSDDVFISYRPHHSWRNESVRSDNPFPIKSSLPLIYYEMKLVKGKEFAIGLCREHVDFHHTLPGVEGHSVGYHYGGIVYCQSQFRGRYKSNKLSEFEEGDVVGMGMVRTNSTTGELFFTLNGDLQGYGCTFDLQDLRKRYYIVIGGSGASQKDEDNLVEFNFGGKEFVFSDVSQLKNLKSLKTKALAVRTITDSGSGKHHKKRKKRRGKKRNKNRIKKIVKFQKD